jgi:hypothetical protein
MNMMNIWRVLPTSGRISLPGAVFLRGAGGVMVGVSNIVNAADVIAPALLASEPECFE